MIRKTIAGALIRLAHKIYRPTVTEMAAGIDQIIVGDKEIPLQAGEHVIRAADVDDYIARRDQLNSLLGYS